MSEDASRERQRVWSTWLDELSFAHNLEYEEDRDELAALIAEVVADTPRGTAVAVRTDEKARRQCWRRWLDSVARVDLARGEQREYLASRLADEVSSSSPQRGTWGGWTAVRPRPPIAACSDDELRSRIAVLTSKYGRAQRMILAYLARHGLDLVRDGAARCGESVVAFAELLKGEQSAAPFLPALADRLGQPIEDVRALIAGEYREKVERALDPHVECFLNENCGGVDCPPALALRKRDAEKVGAWSRLVLSATHGGRRHFLDGEPVSCGSTLELQSIAYRSDDYGEYTVPQPQGVGVRYEADLGHEDAPATLHGDVGGHEFIARLEPWMRFRWPGRSN